MAWYQTTLTDMEKAIEREDWNEVKRILQLHHRYLDKEATEEVKNDISDIGFYISEYGQHMTQISACLKDKLEKGSNTKDIMELKVRAAKQCALQFEKTIQKLIKEEKFME